MSDPVLLCSLVRLREWDYRAFRERFAAAARDAARQDRNPALASVQVSKRTWLRWMSGTVRTKPYPDACRVLKELFGYPAEELFAPGTPDPDPDQDAATAPGGPAATIEEMLKMIQRRAFRYAALADESNAGPGTVDALREQVAGIGGSYLHTPVTTFLDDLVVIQENTFTLLEGRQAPQHTADLYVIAGLASGLLAKASHDLRNPSGAITQARLAATCAERAGHVTLQAWVAGLKSLIVYWDRRPGEAREYAKAGLALPDAAGTVRPWLHSLDARAAAAQGDAAGAFRAVNAAETARENLTEDDLLDRIGGVCSFDEPRQKYYAAEAGAKLPGSESGSQLGRRAGIYAQQAIDGYAAMPDPAFGDLAGARAAQAVARIRGGQVDAAAEAIAPVLTLPAPMRIHGVRRCAEHVHGELAAAVPTSSAARDLQEEIEAFCAAPLALSR